MTRTGVPLAYYLAHVDDETEECINWPYAKSKGYGTIWLDGRQRAVHALACERYHGPGQPGQIALHAPVICHNPACFNWRHLRWGSRSDNTRDSILDGTFVTNVNLPHDPYQIGERHWRAKLTWIQVREIRARWAAGERQIDLAAEYGVQKSAINRIVHRTRWTDPDQ
jgi:hypothetical protein